jgi:hypothetical protein
MAGPFGFEKEKFAISQAVGERVLLPAVRNAPADAPIVSDGFSCRRADISRYRAAASHPLGGCHFTRQEEIAEYVVPISETD